jgi:quercetin dioxygenase-like cupin family protein
MRMEVITNRDDLVIRRLVLEPGEAMPWHTDSRHRFSVVIRGEELRIEFRDTREQVTVAVHPGMEDWDEPDARVHRGVNAGTTPYEEVVTCFLPAPGLDPQPDHPQGGL